MSKAFCHPASPTHGGKTVITTTNFTHRQDADGKDLVTEEGREGGGGGEAGERKSREEGRKTGKGGGRRGRAE